MPENEEILSNIWTNLSSDGSTNNDYPTWKANFVADPEIQANVYNHLSKNPANNIKAKNQEEWTANVMGKTTTPSPTPGVEGSENGASQSGTRSIQLRNETRNGRAAFGMSVNGGIDWEVVDADAVPEEWFADEEFRKAYDDLNTPSEYEQRINTLLKVENPETGQMDINKSFFDKEDEDAVTLLKAQFGDAYNFEEVVWGMSGDETSSGQRSMSGVRVSTKDGKKSTKIEFNIDGLVVNPERDQILLDDKDIQSAAQAKAYEKSFNDLTSFMADNKSVETETAISSSKEEALDLNAKLMDMVSVGPNQLKSIEEKYSAEDIFDIKEEVSYVSTNKDYYSGTPQKIITKTQPHEKELKQAMKDLGVNSMTPEVKDRARQILLENERLSIKEANTTKFLEQLEDGDVFPVSFAMYKDEPERLKALLQVGGKQFNQEYAIKTELYNSAKLNLENDKDITAFSVLSDKLNNPEYDFKAQEGQEFVTLQDGRKVQKAVIDQYEKERLRLKPKYEEFFKLQNDLIDNRTNIKDSRTQLDLLRRDYNDFERFFVVSGAGFADLANNINGITSNEDNLKFYQRNKAAIQARRDEYSKTVSFDDAFSSPVNFGRFAANEFANQVSIFAALAIPYAGWGVILSSSYGEQYGTMGLEDLDKPLDERRSMWNKSLVSAGYAIPELAFELAATVPLMKGFGNAMKGMYGEGFRTLTIKGAKQFAVDNVPKFVVGATGESLSEGATTVTQNVVTGKLWHENVDHSLFSGLMIGTTLAGAPLVLGAITNQLSDYAVNEEFRKNLLTSNKIKQDNKNLNTKVALLKKRDLNGLAKLAEQDIVENNQQLKELEITNENIIKDQQESLMGRWLGWGEDNKSGMSEGALREFVRATTDQEKIRLEAVEIDGLDISTDEKNARLKKLKNRFDILQYNRDAFKKEKNSEFNGWASNKKNKIELDKYLLDAESYINNLDSKNTPSWINTLKDKSTFNIARVLWNIKKINKNIASAKNREGDVQKDDLIVYQSTEEAVADMERREIDAKYIASVRNGAHGFDIEAGVKKAFIVVENMAKDDRLETKTHELSHRMLRNAIGEDPLAFKDISETIINWAKENDQGLYVRLQRSVQRKNGEMLADEVLAVFLEEAAGDRIKLQGLGGILGFMTTRVMSDKFAYDMDFAGESDAIKMLVGLGKKLKAGRMTLKDVAALKKNKTIALAKNKADFLEEFSTTKDKKVYGKMSESSDSQTTNRDDLFTQTNEALVEALEMYGMERPERLLSEDIEVRRELAKEWEALGDSRFWIGDIIGQKWRKFIEVNYLSKRDKAANYDLYKDEILDMASTGIESGDNGIPFLVRAWKPAEEGGRTLTSHIYGEIETRLMATGGIIDRKFPQFDRFMSQIDESFDDGGVDLEGDLGIDEVLRIEQQKKDRKAKLEANRYRVKAGIDNKFAEEIKQELEAVLLNPDLGSIDQFEWTQRFSKESQKKLFKVMKEQMKDYDTYLRGIRKAFLEHAHTSDLVQMEKMEANKIFTKLIAVNASPNKIKLAFLEDMIKSFEVKSMTQGPNIYKKLDTKEDAFVAFMKVRGRKDALVKAGINIIAMDAVFDILENGTAIVDGKKVPFMDAFIKNQREQGLPSVSNVLSVVKERINRDQDVKFSATVRGFNDLDLALFYRGLNSFGTKINLLNVGDEDAVRRSVEEVWGDVYSKSIMNKLSKDLFKLVSRYNTIDTNHTNLDKSPDQNINKYLHDSLKAAELQQNLVEFLDLRDENGKFIKMARMFDDINRINTQRAEIETLGHKLIEKYGKEKALRMMVMAAGMYSSSTKIGRGKFRVNDKGIVYAVFGVDADGRNTWGDKVGYSIKQIATGKTEQVGTQRYQVFESASDYNNMLKRVFGDDIKTTALIAETSAAALKDRNFEGRKAQAKLAEEFVKDIAQHFTDQIKAKKLSKTDFAMMMMSMASNMRSPLKRAANLKYIYKDKAGKKYKGKLRYEHMIPTNYMVMAITDAYMNDGDVNLDELFEQYNVAVIPRAMDDILEKMGFQFIMPIDYVNGQRATKRYYNMSTYGHPDLYAVQSIDPKDNGKIFGEGVANIKMSENLDSRKIVKRALIEGRKTVKESRGITVLDFDDTLATSKSLIRYTTPEGVKGTLNAEQYAKTYQELTDLGYEWDFSEFSKVVKGKIAPLFNKAMKLQGKFGPENMFVLTARPAEAAPAIFEFLQANGLNIPLKNITGLANSTAEAKALWMAEKVGEGYNDFYFADDALQNVQAVDNILEQFDVKRKVQQARVKFSESMDGRFNDILENITGIESKKRFSQIKARKRGDSKGKFRIFIPPSHEDFVGLLYNFMGKGREGDSHRYFWEKALVRPLNRAYREIDTAKQAIANDHKALNKSFPNVEKKLIKNTPDGDFTFQDAIRVYLWDKHGYTVPGLTVTDQQNLVEIVKNDSELQAYAETLNTISKQDKYVDPGPSWETGNIRIDLVDATGRVGRKEYFAEFNENVEVIFSEDNLNKVEAAYGKNFREALEDMLHRIKTGVNRPKGSSAKPNMFMNWLNASVSGVMFFNTRSALLQQMSNVNYLNFADNNIFKAGLAFANQKQYWKDFTMIFNSDMMKQRRGGLGTDINGAELAEAIKKARPDNMFDQVAIIVGQALKAGFTPTQIGDNIAIATGGATFYRNRVNTYLKDGMSQKEAEASAFTDFQNITQSTQQSARPDMTSQQQASWIGKLVLNFLNTPSQYNRIIKKAGSDIKNRRITGPNSSQIQSDMSNLSRILYYGAAQNLIFYGLQTALFAVMFGDEEDEEAFLKKKERVISGSIDTILRGSGIYGVAISTLKNMFIKFMEQREADYNKDESAVLLELANFSPVVGIKLRRIVNAEKTINYNGKVIEEMETMDIDNPAWSAVTNYTQSLTGAPVNKIYQKTINLRNAADSEYTALQRTLFLSGYTTWSLNLGDTKKMEGIKSNIKSKKKSKKKGGPRKMSTKEYNKLMGFD